jgi:predicted Mrr-cat superfamily restriction endonuclease
MYSPRTHADDDVAMVRAGEKAHLCEICRDCGVVTIGWFHTPPRDMSTWKPDDLERYMEIDYPVGQGHLHRDGTSSVWTRAKFTRDINQIGDFLYSMDPGRLVTVASPGTQELLIGEITGPYDFKGQLERGFIKDPYLHFKPVNWLATIQSRDMSEELRSHILNRRYQTVFWYTSAPLIEELRSFI